jgi:hypothetical protein
MNTGDRLAELKGEFEKGQAELVKLDQRRQEVCTILLRISGAIQVLQEMEDGQQPASLREPALAGARP